ncbi:hypothetical protein JOE25_000543 [Serratia sp. PL17]|nr:hypothetical protein [Serratia sp. PL17]
MRRLDLGEFEKKFDNAFMEVKSANLKMKINGYKANFIHNKPIE